MPFTQVDFTAPFCRDLIAKYGNLRAAANAICAECQTVTGNPAASRTVQTWMAEHVGPRRIASQQERMLTRANPENENRIAGVFDRASIPPPEVRVVRTIHKEWGVAAKNNDGEIVTEGMYGTTVVTEPIGGPRVPEFPVLQPAPPKTIAFNPAPRILRSTRVAIVYSDAQIGFLRDSDSDALEEIHDSRALDLAEQITADVSPDEQAWIGDWMDWTELSRWPKHPEMRRCLQPSVDAGSEWLARLRAAARRKTKAIMIGSNHGDRPELSMLAYNMEAVTLKRAARIRQPDEWPIHSEAFLLGYDDLGIEFSGRYPGGEYYMTPDLVLVHAPPKRLEFRASVIHGHTHKLTRTTTVTHGQGGRHTHFIYDIGCMCQLGTTSNARRLMVTRVPSDRGRTSWTQGVALVEIVDSSGSRPGFHAVEQIALHEGGWAQFRGKTYESRNIEKEVP